MARSNYNLGQQMMLEKQRAAEDRKNRALAYRMQMVDDERLRQNAVQEENARAFNDAREAERSHSGISAFSSDGQGGFHWSGNADPWGDAMRNQQEAQRQQMIAQHNALQNASWGEVDGILKQTRRQQAQRQLAIDADKASIMRAAAENGGRVPNELVSWFNRKYGGDGQRTGLLPGSGFLQNGSFRLSFGDGNGGIQNEDTSLENQYAIANRYSGIFGDDVRRAQRDALASRGFSPREIAMLERNNLSQQRFDFEKQKYADKKNGAGSALDDWIDYEKDAAGGYVLDKDGNRKSVSGRRRRLIEDQIAALKEQRMYAKDKARKAELDRRISNLGEYMQNETDRLTGFGDWMANRQAQTPSQDEQRAMVDSARPTFKGTALTRNGLMMYGEDGVPTTVKPGVPFRRNGHDWVWTGPLNGNQQGRILSLEEAQAYRRKNDDGENAVAPEKNAAKTNVESQPSPAPQKKRTAPEDGAASIASVLASRSTMVNAPAAAAAQDRINREARLRRAREADAEQGRRAQEYYGKKLAKEQEDAKDAKELDDIIAGLDASIAESKRRRESIERIDGILARLENERKSAAASKKANAEDRKQRDAQIANARHLRKLYESGDTDKIREKIASDADLQALLKEVIGE